MVYVYLNQILLLMKSINKISYLLLLAFFFQFITKESAAQKQDEIIKVQWIFNIAYGVTWQDQENISTYTIGVFSSKSFFRELQKQAETRTIKGKPVEVVRYSNYEAIQPNHIIYVSRNENSLLGFVYQKLKGKNVLIISDRSKQPAYSVVNFRKVNEDNPKPYDLNTKLAEKNNLLISRTLIRTGGSREDIQKIYAQTNRELVKEQKILDEMRQEIEGKEKLLEEQENKIKAQRDSISGKEHLISAKESKLKKQNAKLNLMTGEIEQQRENLKKNISLLKKQEENIAKQKEFAEKLNEEILEKSESIKKQEDKLKKNQARLSESQETVASQQNIIYFAIVAIIIFIFLGVIIINSYINKQKVNKELSRQYVAINSQKNEIQNQAKLLESANTELEKLSIVASETDNAVTIMDKKGNFLWVNPGFTRMYGYTLQLLKNEIGGNLIAASNNPEVSGILKEILEEKETRYYQNLSKARTGEEIWTQTTLTPILDENANVVQLISIDTDITAEKKSAMEIKKQRDKIEIQNEQITSSINYAKTIQQAILPLFDDIQRNFSSFVIFRPRDVVSGDFYWYNEKVYNDGKSKKLFLAAVDCTGHGVPGAFMSMIGSRLLNEVILEQDITDPKDVLENLDQKVKTALRQETSENNDGMDMSVCVIEKKDDTYHITYSGAKSDLYYYSHGEEGIGILQSERRSIGGTKQKRGNIKFTNKTIKLKDNDLIWLASDGIIDQNNPSRKRFGTPKFIETLNAVKDLELIEQKRYINRELDDYKEETEQRDDIMVWGIKFSKEKW